jgi:ATP-dependent helicase/nuclease subunit A
MGGGSGGWRVKAVPKDVADQQRKASDPALSVWVSANAGSGKTHVLAQRVQRLLLDGVPPAKILCLTFTKAAAANMAERVFKTLADWTALDDATLASNLFEIGVQKIKPETLIFARRLFARTVETPGGLKIHTIHGFCERLLHLFPFEANVPGRFDVLDDLGEAELLALARRETLAQAQNAGHTLSDALKTLAAETSEDDFAALLKEAIQYRAHLRHYDLNQAAHDLGCALHVPDGTRVLALETEMIEGGIGPARWTDFAEFLDTGHPTDRDRAALFRLAAASYRRGDQGRRECLAAYSEIFFTIKGERRKSLVTKALAAARCDLASELAEEQARLDRLRELRKAAACLEKSLALTTLVAAIFERYEALKAARGKLDFDDLIERTLALFERSDARWVLYKLDSGIDHILVDEAQDTSPAQWRILEYLASEFHAGTGSRADRTFFAVGDEKQSIFSFQGAAPYMFHEMQRSFATKFASAKQVFTHILLKTSFRSVPAVLEAVDRVFGHAEHQRGLVSDDQWMGHEPLKKELPGLIEIWPPVTAPDEPDPGDWRLPLDLLDESDTASILAHRIAKKIAALTAPGSNERVYDTKLECLRPINAGDVLILVRKRSAVFDAIIRALKQEHVPVAGADRLDLLAHIAVMDLIAAGHAALLPQDDLTLASVLKSPLIGFDDDDLLRVAPQRHGSLFNALAQSAETTDQMAYQTVSRWRARASDSAFDFYARLLSEDGGRRAMEARLGPEACDAMDEFLRLVLRAEKDGIRSLPGFLAEVESLELSIKRDMDTAADAVRVMTVHAAKGLEAKIVFLPDTCSAPSGRHDAKIHLLNGQMPDSKILAWSSRKDDDPAVVAAARQAARDEAENEYRRLLYVAMTRAEERLYISGFYRKAEPSALCWGTMIEATRGDVFVEAPAFWDVQETIWRYEASGSITAGTADARSPKAPLTALPDWLMHRARLESSPKPPLRPSSALAAGEVEVPAPGTERHAALVRGRLVHTLLQYLPDIEPLQRRDAADTFLQARASDLDADARRSLADQVLAVLEMPELAGLDGQAARAEVSLAGTITLPNGKTRDILGQIDRLAESDTEVIVADYKTGTPVAAEATPQNYLAQMALYRALLASLWPDKRLRMLLVWTEGPEIAEVSTAQLDAALAAID